MSLLCLQKEGDKKLIEKKTMIKKCRMITLLVENFQQNYTRFILEHLYIYTKKLQKHPSSKLIFSLFCHPHVDMLWE